MVTLLPRRKTFGEEIGSNLGQGLSQGFLAGQEQAEKSRIMQQLGIDPRIAKLPEEAQAAYFKQAFSPEKQMTPLQQSQKALTDERLKALQGQQDLFKRLNEQPQSPSFEQSHEKQGISNAPEEILRQVAAFKGQPGEAGIIGNMAEAELNKRSEERKGKTEKEKEYFKMNEPKLIELSDNQRKLEMEQARYDRLNNLFSDPSKFPSTFTAALFSKEGQINDLAYSQLTPEAQEALKLIIDSTSNIKDTYGARVTNFDLQTYLKKLPSLLNSPEGKMRVLRDLQIMNKLNQLHASGIQEIFEEAGGTDKIPYSKAEARYKKRYGGLEKDLKDQFVNPEKATFKEMPDANKFLGRKIKNPETGEVFISDGKEWKPFKG